MAGLRSKQKQDLAKRVSLQPRVKVGTNLPTAETAGQGIMLPTAKEMMGRTGEVPEMSLTGQSVSAADGRQFYIAGVTEDGIEVYETSDKTKKLSYKERIDEFKRLVTEDYRGRTAKFVKNGEVFYAKFSPGDVKKSIYGDTVSDPEGWKAKINTGAEGNVFELVENATFDRQQAEKGKDGRMHKKVDRWSYFVKTVQIDNAVFDVLANVRERPDGEYVYSITLKNNNEKTPAPPLTHYRASTNDGGRVESGVPTSVNNSIPQFAPNSQENTAGNIFDGHVLPTAKEQMEQAKREQRAAKAKTEVERTGILLGVPDKIIQAAKRISKVLGIEVCFYRNTDGKVKNDKGYYNRNDRKIYLNAEITDPVAFILGHEMIHHIQLTKSYLKFAETILKKIQQDGGNLDAMRQELKERYARNGVKLNSVAEVDQDVIAEYAQEHLFTDEASIISVVNADKEGGSIIARFLDTVLAKFGDKDAQERAFVQRARSLYAKALRESNREGQANTYKSETVRAERGEATKQAEGHVLPTAKDMMAQGGRTNTSATALDTMTDPEYDEAMDILEAERSMAGESVLYDDGRQYSVSKHETADEENRGSFHEREETTSRITVNMGENERYEVLKNKRIPPTEVESGADIDAGYLDYLENNIKSVVEKGLLKKFKQMGLFKKYKSIAVGDISFDFTGKGFRKSIHSQETAYGGSKADFAKVLLSLESLLDASVLIECHTDKGRGTDKEKFGLDKVYVLFSALNDNGKIVPVQFEIEQYVNEQNRLYLAVALTKIETGVKGNTAPDEQKSTSLVPVSNISIAEIFSKINPADKNFLKYIPVQFLDTEQIEAKNEALKRDKEKYTNKKELREENIQYAIAKEPEDRRIDELPKKAQTALRQTESRLSERIGEILGVPKHAQRDFLQGIIRDISEDYLQSGMVDQAKADALFEEAYKQGVVVDAEYFERYKHIRDHLRNTQLTISEEDRSSIADFDAFWKSAFGKLRIVNEGGLPVDVAYEELEEMAPELFPEDITHPADQLQHMFEIADGIRKTEQTLNEAYGEEAETFKAAAKDEFHAALNSAAVDFKRVKRYAESRSRLFEEQEAEKKESVQSREELDEAYKNLKTARRNLEKVRRSVLLTEQDEMRVGQLLRGEISPVMLNPEQDNVKDIIAVYRAKQEYENYARRIRDWNTRRKEGLRAQAREYLANIQKWKDKVHFGGLRYSRETMERNFRDIMGEDAEALIAEYLTPVHKGQADIIYRFITKNRNAIAFPAKIMYTIMR